MGEAGWRLHQLGRGLLLHGMFIGLVVGVGGLAFPLMTRGEAPSDVTASARDRAALALHALGALGIAATVWLQEVLSLRAALFTRGAIVALALCWSAALWRPPSKRGLNRWLIWFGGWMLPAGYLLAGLFPLRARAGLHVAFIGGLALLAMSVGAQVILGHGGRDDLKDGHPWPLVFFAVLLLGAVVPRALVEWNPSHFPVWLTAASALFLAATMVWLVFLAPHLRPPTRSRVPGAPIRPAA
jgi:uncharacterized protein involved in response to NO